MSMNLGHHSPCGPNAMCQILLEIEKQQCSRFDRHRRFGDVSFISLCIDETGYEAVKLILKGLQF